MFFAESMEPLLYGVIGVVALIVIVLVILVGWYIAVSNMFNRMIVKIDEAESGIDVALTKRYDLLKKMFQVVKGYAAHESETLAKVIAMRKPGGNASIEEKQEYANQLSTAMRSINVVAEQYPTLKADASFMKLQDTVSDVEENLQAARRLYNSNISIYNQRVVSFPDSFVAKRKGLQKRAFFEAEEEKRQDVDLDFSK